MRNLLSAGLFRLLRSKQLWLTALAIAAFMGVFIVSTSGQAIHYGEGLDSRFFYLFLLADLFCAVFCSLHLGQEYGEGAIRNKLMAGHSRISVYLAGLTCSFLASLLLLFIGGLGAIAFGLPLIGGFQMTESGIAAHLACGVGSTAVYASVYTLLAFLIPNRALSAAACFLTSILTLSFSQKIFSGLEQPERILSQYLFTPEGAQLVENGGEGALNPAYVGGVQRTIYEFFNDVLPTGQGFQISNLSVERPWLLLAYSLVLVLLTTALGLFLFRRKDVK